ncbi:DNA repair protein rad2 [Coemansia interrupta]|uniref:DNA repair protein rad2 n=1 Tax=Coemansia interrupta TaxID=1126814 RepID=A0A9W8HNM0_9FUNG|nr:DNA repair protein rad2 [Coemansia interrupta]
MGVKGLWTLLEPAARPVRLESLANKRLAIDASIWLYQLLKAMKDDEGDPLEDAHILGFYRRICKLLYYDIRPVFVFDGGAPELKRLTIDERQSARMSRNQDAKRAAQQLLQTQLKLQALNGSPAKGKQSASVSEEVGPETPSPAKKRKRDEYELPPMTQSVLDTREENLRDLRMAHPDDLRQLVRMVARYPETLGNLDDIDVDIESDEFKSLSPEDQHDIIVALKLRSRQTSHDRLQGMLDSSQNALDFSKQQIDLLVKRNNLTQQWLQVTGNGHRMTSLSSSGPASKVSSGRIIGERNREYVLIKNDNDVGGFTLRMDGGGTDRGELGDARNPIVVKGSSSPIGSSGSSSPHSSRGSSIGRDEEDSDDSESGSDMFEDVPPAVHSGLQSLSPRMDAGGYAGIQPSSGGSMHLNASSLPQPLAAQPVLPGYDHQSMQNPATQTHAFGLQRTEPASPIDYVGLDESQGIRVTDAQHTDIDYFMPESEIEEEDYSQVYDVSSDDDDALSDYGGNSISDLVSSDDGVDEISLIEQRRHQEMLLRREQEDMAILALPMPEFLDTWMRLVTPEILSFDSTAAETMQMWFLDEPTLQLEGILWRISRRLEKLPDIADLSARWDCIGDIRREQIVALQPKFAYLSLMSNYLGFVLRWKRMRSASHSNGHSTGPASTYGEDAVKHTSVPNSAHDIQADIDVIPENQDSSSAHRQTIFEKARLLAEFGNNSSTTSEADQKPESCETQKVKRARNMDSDSEEDVSDVDDVEPEAHESAAIGTDAGESQSAVSLGDDSDSDHDDGDMDVDLDTGKAEQLKLLRNEQDEYKLFVKKLKVPEGAFAVNGPSYESMRGELEMELQSLRSRVRDSTRDASGIGADMVEDIRMLLSLFGIPYITAPMEAEAQCAVLINSGLVDGMVTDDSDAFLFASSEDTSVYRHFFQKDRFVEMYSSKNIYHDSSLAQRDFIFLAYLLGSDYTVGIKGIGPVLAMEALAEFGPGADQTKVISDDEESIIDALQTFGSWCRSVIDVLPGIEIPKELLGTAQKRRLAQAVRKTTIPTAFPDPRVVRAYLHPQVDDSEEAFSWGFPKIDLLRQFLSDRLGWSFEKTNETLVPLVRKMTEEKSAGKASRNQLTLDAYAVSNANTTAQHSKRIGKAISSHRKHANNDASPKSSKESLASRRSLI